MHEEEVERKQRQHQQQHKFEVQEGNDRGNEPGEGAAETRETAKSARVFFALMGSLTSPL